MAHTGGSTMPALGASQWPQCGCLDHTTETSGCNSEGSLFLSSEQVYQHTGLLHWESRKGHLYSLQAWGLEQASMFLKMGQGFPQSQSLGEGGRGREERVNHRSLEPQKSFHRKYSFQFVQKRWANRNRQRVSPETSF